MRLLELALEPRVLRLQHRQSFLLRGERGLPAASAPERCQRTGRALAPPHRQV
jgi:hypothetical protein